MLAARKREIKDFNRLAVAQTRQEREALRIALQEIRNTELALRIAKREEALEAKLAARAARESARVLRAKIKRQPRERRKNAFQPYMFRIGRIPSPSKVFKDALSLDAPRGGEGRRFNVGSMADTVADPTPNVLEKMVAAEGIQRVIQRLSDEKHIPLTQARAIVEALVDSDILEDESVCDLADMLRSGWSANRLTTPDPRQVATLAVKPTDVNPEPYQYDHWRRRYGLAKSGRVITRDVSIERFGGAWSVETALPEEIEKIG